MEPTLSANATDSDDLKVNHFARTQSSITVCALGMHRSGTSCLAGSLQAAGLLASGVETWSADNLKGNRENQAIRQLNEVLLAFNDAAWDNPPAELSWRPEHAQRRNKLIASFNAAAHIWMFKDPRALLTFPFLEEGFEALGNDVLFVGTFRHPSRVALSLYQRSQMPFEQGIQLWIHYNQKLVALFERSPFPVVCFDLPKEKYKQQLQNAIRQLNDRLPAEYQLCASAAQSFYSEELVNHTQSAAFAPLALSDESAQTQRDSLQEAAEKIYQKLCAIAHVPIIKSQEADQSLHLPLSSTAAACEQAIQAQPSHPQLHFMLGNAQRREGHLQAAAASYQKAIALHHSQPFDVYRMLGETLETLGEAEDAIATYQQGIRDVYHPQLYVLLARALIKTKRFDEAEDTLHQLIEKQPSTAQHKVSLGNLYLHHRKDSAAALEIFQQAVALDPTQYIAKKHLGIALMRQEQLEDALAMLLSAQREHPQQSDIYLTLGQCYQRQKNWQAAADSYQHAIAAVDNVPLNIYFNLGVMLQNLRQYQAAKAAYQYIVEAEPNHTQALKRLNQVCEQIKSIEA